jgi:hypothetical protein
MSDTYDPANIKTDTHPFPFTSFSNMGARPILVTDDTQIDVTMKLDGSNVVAHVYMENGRLVVDFYSRNRRATPTTKPLNRKDWILATFTSETANNITEYVARLYRNMQQPPAELFIAGELVGEAWYVFAISQNLDDGTRVWASIADPLIKDLIWSGFDCADTDTKQFGANYAPTIGNSEQLVEWVNQFFRNFNRRGVWPTPVLKFSTSNPFDIMEILTRALCMKYPDRVMVNRDSFPIDYLFEGVILLIANGMWKLKRPVLDEKGVPVHTSCMKPRSDCNLTPFVNRINSPFADPACNGRGRGQTLFDVSRDTLTSVILCIRSKYNEESNERKWFQNQENQLAVYEELISDEYEYPKLSQPNEQAKLFKVWMKHLMPPKQKQKQKQKQGRMQNRE